MHRKALAASVWPPVRTSPDRLTASIANTLTDPTLTALLYDPYRPLGSRISILNTTIVARMYHSEAILLHDGKLE